MTEWGVSGNPCVPWTAAGPGVRCGRAGCWDCRGVAAIELLQKVPEENAFVREGLLPCYGFSQGSIRPRGFAALILRERELIYDSQAEWQVAITSIPGYGADMANPDTATAGIGHPTIPTVPTVPRDLPNSVCRAGGRPGPDPHSAQPTRLPCS